MCGFSFYCHAQHQLRHELQASLQAIAHRGPDDRGIFQQTLGAYSIGLGHNRLSILDLSSAGKQPMHTPLGVVITYNGEIYNHQELRAILQKKEYHFHSHTDTEVVALLYSAFGTASFGMLRGMFAFVLLDQDQQKIFLVRDSIGIKPLYLFHDEHGLYASSEIRGLTAFSAVSTELDRNDIFEFFNQGFLYEPSTGYTHIKKLMPGTFLEFDLKRSTSAYTKYQVTEKKIHDLAETFNNVVSQQCIADVPLGVFFSGGMDSSLIAGFTDSDTLFFAEYDAQDITHHDRIFSEKIASFLKKPLQVARISSQEQTPTALLHTVDFVASHTEELISDYTFWATYQLSLAARNQGYKVMLSGMGGDEVFAGYPRYWVLKQHKMIKALTPILAWLKTHKLYPKRYEKKFERLVSYGEEEHWPTAYSRLLGYFSREDLTGFFADAPTLEAQYQHTLNQIASRFEGDRKDKVKWAQSCDLLGFLSHNLMVSDKASMLAGIELRVPLLDEAIVKYGLSLSSQDLLKKRTLKYPLKALLEKRLPKKLTRRPKTGFNPPLDGLIKQLGKDHLRQAILFLSDTINIDRALVLLDEHFSGKANHTYKLWQLLYFSRWIKLNQFSRRKTYAEATS